MELGFEGSSFHTSKDYGNSVDMPQLNDRRLNRPRYDSGGAEYTVIKNVQLGLTAGAVVYRKIDFEDAGFSPKIDPAPYVQLGAKVSF